MSLRAEVDESRVCLVSLNVRGSVGKLAGVARAVAVVRRARPDVLVGFMFHGMMTARIAGRLAGVPAVVSAVRSEAHGRARERALGATGWMTDAVTVMSDSLASHIAERGVAAPSRLVVIPNAVDFERYAAGGCRERTRRELGVGAGEFLWLAAGRLAPAKDYPGLLRAFAALAGRRQARLLIAGDGPLRGELAGRIDALGLVGRVRLLGLRDDLPELYRACDALVLSSAWEGMPNVVLEAMASARPVVATAVGAVPEMVDARRDGVRRAAGRPRRARRRDGAHDGPGAGGTARAWRGGMPRRSRATLGGRRCRHVGGAVRPAAGGQGSRWRGGRAGDGAAAIGRHHVQLGERIYRFRAPIVRALVERGVRVYAVAPAGDFARDVEALGAEFVPWRLNRGSVNPYTEAGSLVSLLRIYRRLRPDVAQHFTIKPNVYGALAARLAGVPVVVGGVTGLGYAFAEGGRRRSVLRPLARLLYRLTAALSDGVTFQTAHDADVLFGASGRFRRSALVIPGGSGVDLAAFSEGVASAKARREMRAALGIAQGAPVVTMASRLLYDKGVAEYVEAARAVRARRPDAVFVLAGARDPDNRESVTEEDIAAWGRSGDVLLPGHVSDVPCLLAFQM